jgi:succinate dehydrogenase / fumarate reductase, cytochrome b subunit
MPVRPRPLSPHLGIYRWQIGNTLSILHRLTGVALAFGLAALCFWLICVSGGEDCYRMAEGAFNNPVGHLFLLGWTFSFLYHLLNGVRHLFWDMGKGFERVPRHVSGWFAVIGALVLTLGVWAMIWRGGRL